jgi:polyisoprenoid-binding protein YceI
MKNLDLKKNSTLLKGIFIKTTFAALLFSAATIVSTSTAFAAVETFKLDPNHANITWHASHFGFSTPNGKFTMPEGTLVLDEEHPANSTLNVVIDMTRVMTGADDFDKVLKSKQFFDIEQYPTATFESTKVDVKKNKKEAKVHGMLTLHGVTKPVVLDVKLNKLGPNPMFKSQTAGFTASTTIKRSMFDMGYLADKGIGDDVKLNIEAEFAVPAEPKAAPKATTEE